MSGLLALAGCMSDPASGEAVLADYGAWLDAAAAAAAARHQQAGQQAGQRHQAEDKEAAVPAAAPDTGRGPLALPTAPPALSVAAAASGSKGGAPATSSGAAGGLPASASSSDATAAAATAAAAAADDDGACDVVSRRTTAIPAAAAAAPTTAAGGGGGGGGGSCRLLSVGCAQCGTCPVLPAARDQSLSGAAAGSSAGGGSGAMAASHSYMCAAYGPPAAPLLAAAADLLTACCQHGGGPGGGAVAAVADRLIAMVVELGAEGGAGGGAGGGAAGGGAGGGAAALRGLLGAVSAPPTHAGALHVAVASQSRAVVQVLLRWHQRLADSGATAGSSSTGGSSNPWLARAVCGVTPLHVAAGLPDGGELAAWLLATYPAAAAAWRSALSDDGLSPAALAGRMGARWRLRVWAGTPLHRVRQGAWRGVRGAGGGAGSRGRKPLSAMG